VKPSKIVLQRTSMWMGPFWNTIVLFSVKPYIVLPMMTRPSAFFTSMAFSIRSMAPDQWISLFEMVVLRISRETVPEGPYSWMPSPLQS
jgi:hypothetical protein